MPTANNIRVAVRLNDIFPPQNLYTGSTPVIARGNAFEVQVGVFRRADQLADLDGYTSARLWLMSTAADGGAPRAGDPDPALLYWDLTSDVDTSLDFASWHAGTEQHLRFEVSDLLSGVPAGVWWMVCWLEAPTGKVTLFAGRVNVVNDGTLAGNIETPEPLQELRDAAVLAADRAEAAAADAEATAANLSALAEALSYRGTHDASTGVPTDPVGPVQRGWFWQVTASGTFGGVTFALGDAALYNGAAWQRVALDTIMAALAARVTALEAGVRRTSPQGAIVLGGGYVRFDSPPPIDASGHTVSCLVDAPAAVDGATIWATARSSGHTLMRLYYFGAGSLRLVRNNTADTSYRTWTLPRVSAGLLTLVFGAGEQCQLYVDGVSLGTFAAVAGTGAPYDDPGRLHLGAFGYNGSSGYLSGTIRNFSWITATATAAQIADLAASGGRVIPQALRAHAHYFAPLADVGPQQRADGLSQRLGVASPSGVTPVVPRDNGSVSVYAVNASNPAGVYLVRADVMLPVNHVVTAIVVDNQPVPVLAAPQTLSLRRLRAVDSGGGALLLQRSDGTTHQALTAAIPVASLASVAARINHQAL